jgi:hypothetical protein
MHRKPNTVTTINLRNLEWAGHLLGMLNYSAVNKYFWGNNAEEEKREDQD